MIHEADAWRHTNKYYVGAEDLDANGQWQDAPEYGQVWVPNEPDGWSPYQGGTWGYGPYWGWTWVGYAPWGWAPYHTGLGYGTGACIHGLLAVMAAAMAVPVAVRTARRAEAAIPQAAILVAKVTTSRPPKTPLRADSGKGTSLLVPLSPLIWAALQRLGVAFSTTLRSG